MSRVAKRPVVVPSDVEVSLEGQYLLAKGKLGELSIKLHNNVAVEHSEGKLQVAARDRSVRTKALSGTTRALLANVVHGVNHGFKKKLELRGVGYRAQLKGRDLHLTLGYSHPVLYSLPEGIAVDIASPTEVSVTGIDKQKVGQVAAEIRSLRPPECYKGKGVRYSDEQVIIKETKKK